MKKCWFVKGLYLEEIDLNLQVCSVVICNWFVYSLLSLKSGFEYQLTLVTVIDAKRNLLSLSLSRASASNSGLIFFDDSNQSRLEN